MAHDCAAQPAILVKEDVHIWLQSNKLLDMQNRFNYFKTQKLEYKFSVLIESYP